MGAADALRARPLMRAGALAYLYRRRLRVHAVQEMLAGAGVAVGVALVFATIIASASVAGSAGEVVRAVTGPASLQLRARSASGFGEGVLRAAERLPGVRKAAPLLEQTATIATAGGRRATVDLAGADTSLVVLDGLAHTLPTSTLKDGGIGLSQATARALGILAPSTPTGAHSVTSLRVALSLDGHVFPLSVSAVLGPETFGALSQARVAVMPLDQLQKLASLPGRISRVLVQTRQGERAAVQRRLAALAGGRMDVVPADQDVALLRQALRPADQASAFFAALSALLGLLLAATAMLLTAPERRRLIADLRLNGAPRSAIVQLFVFQALLLGFAASLVGVLCGYILSHTVLHQSTAYLAEAFTLGTRTALMTQPLAIALCGGVLATCLASAAPLLDLRSGRTVDAVLNDRHGSHKALSRRTARVLFVTASALFAASAALFAAAPAQALLASALVALGAVLTVPLMFARVLAAGGALCTRRPALTILPVALSSLRSTTLRSLALAATGGLALFGAVALGGARGDLQRGIERFARSYSVAAQVWVGSASDNQAVVPLGRGVGADGGVLARHIAQTPGVASVSAFYGGFLALGDRRAWVIARPAASERSVLESQLVSGDAREALRHIGEGGWIAVSQQIANEHHTGAGGYLALPTPSGPSRLRIAATTTNLAWSPGVVFMSSAQYARLWAGATPTALAVKLERGMSEQRATTAIARALGPSSGLEAVSARKRERSIDALTGEGLEHLSEISTLLELAAILALAAALTSAIWQRRKSLAGLRLAGVRPRRLRAILLVESALILGAGCATGAITGVYGQLGIDGYLRHVTGFPVATLAARMRPLEISLVVIAIVLAIAAGPVLRASQVSPKVALHD
jgi:putative ABC transport system permease protein